VPRSARDEVHKDLIAKETINYRIRIRELTFLNPFKPFVSLQEFTFYFILFFGLGPRNSWYDVGSHIGVPR
jgi:hypothetical protein